MSVDNYKIKIGTVTLDEPYEGRYFYETAGWKTTYALEPGTYDVHMAFRKQHGDLKLEFETDEISGVITEHDTQGVSGKDDVGKPVSEPMKINPYDVTKGLIALDIEVPYVSLDEKDGYPRLRVDMDHPEFLSVLRERESFEFKSLFRSVESRLVDYAQKHGFLEGEKLKQGMEMGTLEFGTLIRFDQYLRGRFGGGLEDFQVTREEFDKVKLGKWGHLEDIFQEMTEELSDKHDFSKAKTDQHPGFGF